ncbi:hypothetical protein SAMN04488168_13425 [Bacillus sp. 491mf]|uniref:hypothetical protein n=1 Tax=Bacillus TaxID=1386 RepID=UPI00054E7763|nr:MULTISPECIES: hypothetical protein [unclassified Bacillus (in: firmicutes)]SFD35620.1 hypothetical protein SAMN04488168_13425 [Bacillus sp. 491mf]
MDKLFLHVLNYICLMLVILGALLLFPFFPTFVLFLMCIFMFGIAIIISFRSTGEQEKESRMQRAKL